MAMYGLGFDSFGASWMWLHVADFWGPESSWFWQAAGEKQPVSKHLWCDSELSPAKDAQNLRNSDGLPHNKGQSSVTQAMSDNNDSDIEVIMVSRARKRQEPPLPPAIKLEPGLGDQEVEIIESSPVAGSEAWNKGERGESKKQNMNQKRRLPRKWRDKDHAGWFSN